MIHARFGYVGLVLWATAMIGATGADLATADISAEEGATVFLAQDPDQRPFRHNEHVSRAWQELENPEVFRDCRGCHRFSKDRDVSTPQAECDNCHQASGTLQRQFGPEWTNDLSAYQTRTHEAFRHYTHGMLECRQCHFDEVDLFAHMPIQTGPGLCAGCHEKAVTGDQARGFRWMQGLEDEALAQAVGLPTAFTYPTDFDAYAKKLDLVFGGVSGGMNTTPLPAGGAFDHADHIASGSVDGIACAVCHTDIATASATQVGTGLIPVDGCKSCHIRDGSKAAAEASQQLRETEPRPLWSLGTFAHADHLGFLSAGSKRKEQVSSDEGYKDIEGQDCAACHTYAPEAIGLSERDFPFDGKSSKHEYANCAQCHTSKEWQTGEQVGSRSNPPLHTSNGGDGWGDCAACHELGKPDMKGLRPQEEVERWSERTFVFEGQTHPHITTEGVAQSNAKGDSVLQKECAACHRATVPSLPTRLIEKAFTHRTHLPENPSQKDCVGCHETAENAANSVALAGAALRTYSLKSCATCHWGDEVREQVDPEAKPQNRLVVAFPHAKHVQAGQSCADCHSVDDAGRDMQTLPAVLSCTQCHKHELQADNKRPPEQLITSEIASCIHCHHSDQGATQVASVPAPRGSALAEIDSRYRATQTVFPGFQQSQFHPASSDCTQCHKAQNQKGELGPVVVPTGKDHLFSKHGQSVHASEQQGGFGQSAPSDCLRCHWKPVGSWRAAVRASNADVAEKRLREMPLSPKTRKRYGNRFQGYPGKKDADG